MNSELITNKPKVSVYFGGRLGNHMFGYASLIGIAHSNNLIPVISESNLLWDVFKLPIHYGHFEANVVIRQKNVGTYEKIVENLEPKDTLLDGYWQSWKYFENVKDELLTKHFLLHDDVDLESDQFILNALKEKHKTKDTTIVGVHIRRGDFVRQRLKGFSAAPVSYYYKAMNYFRRKYSDLLFIMVSNDVFWAEDHLDQGEDIYYSHNTPDKMALDLAILSKCNHSVISSGSFSWWVKLSTAFIN
ncbi:hypothetical protein LOTGIDRAFT_164689 [Lottia gigantea]|uniref:L-Fucosyltransferase n=1 Tax=Lottia gigantea TaxID=225164 RepID=V4BM75_LOTGI|nr:hypothetical protein LOTGIDRAFT_164689 [Lottia gigantea]ESO89989.1 hypothetical protein LOTGIDRAFT_164689 [Lottia gigantea]